MSDIADRIIGNIKLVVAEKDARIEEIEARISVLSETAKGYLEDIDYLKSEISKHESSYENYIAKIEKQLADTKTCKNICPTCGEVNCQGGMYELQCELTDAKRAKRKSDEHYQRSLEPEKDDEHD